MLQRLLNHNLAVIMMVPLRRSLREGATMWTLMPSGGFISAVRKPEDESRGTITIRARVKVDLVELRDYYLPALGPIETGGGTDYAFRAVAKADDFAAACAAMAKAVDYSNYKDHVAAVKGKSRTVVYGRLWSALMSLQRP